MDTLSEEKFEALFTASGEEKERNELNTLLSDWKSSMKDKLGSEKAGLAEGFVWDGFYPFYFSQPLKILFVGKESLGLEGCDYLNVILQSYRFEKRIGKQHLNSHKFCSRLLYVAYGILCDVPVWQDIPYADKIGDAFATSAGISFAFMNVSKFSNENQESWQADHDLMGSSVSTSSNEQRKFIEEEIDFLKPDLVISMNLESYLDCVGRREPGIGDGNVARYRLRSCEHESVLLDTWHFTSWKDDIEEIYLPIRKAIKDSVDDGWLKAFSPYRDPRC